MATGPIETHLHRSFNWENGAAGARMGPRGRSASCGNGLSAQRVRLRSEINPLICNNHTGFLAFRMFSAVCCGVWLELSNQKPIRGVVCILLNTNSMYTERYKEWEGFRRSWHCRKIQKFRFSHNAYLLVFGSE